MGCSDRDLILYIIAFFIPPLSVGIKRGCGIEVLISIGLWILFWIPAVIYACWVISQNPDIGTNTTSLASNSRRRY